MTYQHSNKKNASSHEVPYKYLAESIARCVVGDGTTCKASNAGLDRVHHVKYSNGDTTFVEETGKSRVPARVAAVLSNASHQSCNCVPCGGKA